jgi:PAS domain-containing protein
MVMAEENRMTRQRNDREELIRELKETRKQISELEEREIELVQVVGEDPFRPPDLHLIMFYAGPTGGTVWLPGISRFEFNRSTSNVTANGPEGAVPDFSWLRDYVHPEDFPAVEADLKQFAGGLVPAIYRRHRLILMGAMTVWMEFYALAIKRDENGVPTEGVFCYRPIGRAGGVGSSFNQIVIRLFDLLDSVAQEDSPLSSLFESRYKETKDSSEALRDIWSLVTAIGTAEASRIMKAWDLSFVKDHSMRYVWVSDPFAKTLGLSLSEIQGRSDSELFGTMDQMEDEKTGEAVIRGVTGRVRRTRIVDGTPQMFHDT